MKKIDSLVPDIERVLQEGIKDIDENLIISFGKAVAKTIKEALTPYEHKRALRMSSIGKPCERQLWYDVNHPELAEQPSGATKMKFLYGHLIEDLVIFLAELSGHKVEGRQDVQTIAGVDGHRDVVIDGTLSDVKSASPYSFLKFKEGKLKDDDAFGYVPQIQSYGRAGKDDPIITDKDRVAFVAANKVTGKLALDIHETDRETDYEAMFESKKAVVAGELPARGFDPEPDGASGNLVLGVNCNYCPFKFTCHDNIRIFMYYGGKPKFFTRVNKEPRVPEISRKDLDID